ncbi:MAG: hypothetical protein JST34_15840 [Bacteroidetes bacterium]|nr:hypothetical protein [Bacteroidota bacterium]
MAILKSILFLFLATNTIAQTNLHDTTSKTSRDTLYLYFPLKQAGQTTNESTNSLDTFLNVWYSRMLTAMKEPTLTDYQGDNEIYRFTWLRTFHKPIVIRIQKTKDKIVLTEKMLSGAGGYDPGQIILDTNLVLTSEIWNSVQDKISKLSFWTLPAETEFRGNDGAEWIIEGSTSDKYHFTTRWSAGKGTVYGNFCLYLLSLSSIKVSNLDIY